jgi:hypothetical protein
VIFHPATLLFGWGVFVALVQPLAGVTLMSIAAIILPMAGILATRRAWLLLRRTRWLLFSIALLFSFATPGQRLAGAMGEMGLTVEGLSLALEHILRLLLLLASLAIVHERLGTIGMMAGLHWLLAPLAHWRTLRERIVVRLMLVLDHVENAPATSWREWLDRDLAGPDRMTLYAGTLSLADWIVLASLVAFFILSGATP